MIYWIKKFFYNNDQQSIDENKKFEINQKPLNELLFDDAQKLNQTGDDFYLKSDWLNAEICYRKAILLNENYFEAYINLGLTFDEQKKYQESENVFRKAIDVKPNSALARFNLGVSLKNQLLLGESEKVLREAIEIWPVFFQCHNVLGELLQYQNKYDEAILSFKKSIELSPAFAVAHKNLGDTLTLVNEIEEAEIYLSRSIDLDPNYADAYYSLGFLYSTLAQFSRSEDCYRRAIFLRPEFSHAHCNLGFVLLSQGKNSEIEFHLKKAIELNPLFVEAHCNLGIFYNEEKKFIESEQCYRTAISINPNFANAHSCLGVLLMQNGNFEEAIECYRKGVFLDPNNLIAHSNLLMTLSFYNGCSPENYKEELKSYSEKVSNLAKQPSQWKYKEVDKNKPILRIGFISGDFHFHPVGFFLESVISNINLDQFELIAYSNHPFEDDLTARIKPFFKEWNLISGKSDEDVFDKIYNDGIHILIDLAGHTANNRLPLFAWKPSPIQLSWLGYFASTGVPGIDYVLSDPVAVLPEHRAQFTEEIWYIPNTRLCFTPPTKINESLVAPLPAIKNSYITFGCFQGMAKITDEVISLWSEVLKEIPTSKIRIQNKHLSCKIAQSTMLKRFEVLGIDTDRILLCGPVGRDQYLLDHAKVDMILDTFPFTGGTTTCEALWMGVPTLTLNGDTMLKRQGASLLMCAGLEEWIVDDKNSYVYQAVYFANRLDDLAELRSHLREKVFASPLFDASLFARNFENALLDIWFKK